MRMNMREFPDPDEAALPVSLTNGVARHSQSFHDLDPEHQEADERLKLHHGHRSGSRRRGYRRYPRFRPSANCDFVIAWSTEMSTGDEALVTHSPHHPDALPALQTGRFMMHRLTTSSAPIDRRRR